MKKIFEKPPIIKINQNLNPDFPISIQSSEPNDSLCIENLNPMGSIAQSPANNQENSENINLENANVANPPQALLDQNPQNQNLGNIIHIEDFEEEASSEKPEFKNFIISIVFYTVLGQLFMVFLMSYFIWQLTYIISVIYLAVLDLCHLTSKLEFVRKLEEDNEEEAPLLNKIQILELIVSLTVKILFIFYIEKKIEEKFIYFLITPIAILVFQFFFAFYMKISTDHSLTKGFIVLIFKLLGYCQSAMIVAKMDKLLSWDWDKILWTYWIYFSIMLGVNLGVLFIFMGKIYQSFIIKIEFYKVWGLFWICMILLGFSINSVLFVYSLGQVLLEAKDIKLMKITFIYILIYSGFILIITLFTVNSLNVFLQNLEEDEDDIEINSNSNSPSEAAGGEENNNLRINQRRKKKKIKKTKEPQEFPAFIKKLSSTYFKILKDVTFSRQRNPSKAKFQKKKPEASPKIIKEISKSCELPTNKPMVLDPNASPKLMSRNSMRLKEISHRSIKTNFHVSTRQFLMSEKNRDEEIKSIKTEPVHESENKSGLILFDRNHTNNLDIFEKKNIQKNSHFSPQNKLKDSNFSEKSSINNCCFICCDRSPNAVFMECGHGGFCYECGLEILKKSEECHLCRKKIVQVLMLDLKSYNRGLIKVNEGARLISCSGSIESQSFSSNNN